MDTPLPRDRGTSVPLHDLKLCRTKRRQDLAVPALHFPAFPLRAAGFLG